MKHLVLFALLVLNAGFVQAQMGFGKPEDVAEIKKRPLLVMLEEEDPKKVSKLSKKPDELAVYQNEIKRVNDALKEAVKYWTFHSHVEFKTRSEIKALQESRNKSFGVLSFTRYRVEDWHTNFATSPGSARQRVFFDGNKGSLTTFESYWLSQRYVTAKRDIASVYIDLIEGVENGRPVYLQNLPNLFPTLGDLVFGVQMVQSYLEGRLSGKNRSEGMEDLKERAGVLKQKTLLIDKDDVKGNLTSDDISENYQYKYQLTDYSTIEKAILDKDKNFAYVQIVPMMGTSGFVHYVVDAEKAVVIGYSAPFPIGLKGVSSGAARITAKHLKNYTQFVE